MKHMTPRIRAEVDAFVARGVLPDEHHAEANDLRARVELMTAIAPPVTADEARALSACFGPDDCFGVAWTLLHLIETARIPVYDRAPGPDANEWSRRLWARAGGQRG